MTVKNTAITAAMASPYMNATPVANIPSSAMITVTPASRTARPEVSIALRTALSTSPEARYSSRNLVTMNSE